MSPVEASVIAEFLCFHFLDTRKFGHVMGQYHCLVVLHIFIVLMNGYES